MPVEVTKYTCEFRCGARAVSKESLMIGHENKCWNNPANKTCKTCVHEMYESDNDGMGNQWYYRGCAIPSLDKMLLRVADQLQYNNTIHLRPIYNCNFHNSDNDKGAKKFADLVLTEILSPKEQTEHYPYSNKLKPSEPESEKQEENLPF